MKTPLLEKGVASFASAGRVKASRPPRRWEPSRREFLRWLGDAEWIPAGFSFHFQMATADLTATHAFSFFLATMLDAASTVSDNLSMISPGIIVPMVTPSVV